MLDFIYPEEEQRFFTDREHYLALLALSRTLLAGGIRKHLALSGFRRVGKTVVLKEFLRRHLVEETGSPGASGAERQVAVAYTTWWGFFGPSCKANLGSATWWPARCSASWSVSS